jgi:hypothetical protein
MKRDKFGKLLALLKTDFKNQWASNITGERRERLLDLLFNARDILPDHEVYLSNLYRNYEGAVVLRYGDAITAMEYIERLFAIGDELDEVKERKFLQDAKDKLKEAGLSFEHEDYSSVINNLNTATELALKDELDIPNTISKINTRKILDICISEKIGPIDYLKELIKHVLEIDNKVKHQGYSPDKIDCINAITAVEEFLKKANKYPLKMNDVVKKKIFSGL